MRKETNRYSMERLFDSLAPHLAVQFDVKIVRVPSEGRSAIGFIQNLVFTSRLRADVIHVTGDIYYCALAIPRHRCVLTVHDVVSLYRLKGMRRRVFSLLWYRLPLRWASRVTAISNETTRELELRFPSARGKVEIIPNCVDEVFNNHFKKADEHGHEFRLLQVGTGSNKNLERAAIAASDFSVHLRIVGTLSADQRKLLSTLSLEWSDTGGLSDEDMVIEYQRSDALIFVSTYEGFGLPIVEAQAIGVPVMTSNIEPMMEVAGNAALFVNPYSEDEIRRGLEQLITSSALREQLVELGKRNASRYDPEEIASKYLDLYVETLDSRKS